MARLTDQIKDLKQQLEMARETVDRQNERINDLTRQLQGRIEDSPLFQAQIDSFQFGSSQSAAADPRQTKGTRAELQDRIAYLEKLNDELILKYEKKLDGLQKDLKYWKDRSEQWERLYEISKTNQERLQGLLKESEKEPEPRRRGPKPKADEKKRQEIRELRKQGLTYKAIADQTGMSTTQIFAICREIPKNE